MIQLPRYRHYHRNCRCQAIATTALSPLPHYCHHSIATLLPQKYLHGCRAAIDDIALTPSLPLCKHRTITVATLIRTLRLTPLSRYHFRR